VDLSLCWLEDAQFDGSSFRNARLGCGRNVSYRGAHLDHTDFRHVEISGCDFTGAKGFDTAMLYGAVYDPANPPIGLPAGVLAQCKAEAEPPPTDPRKPTNPREPSEFKESPLHCHATIHAIPIED